MVALGQHLGADQDLVLARLDVAEMGLQLPLATGVVPIDAHHRILRENSAEQLLQLFGAHPGANQLVAATLGAVVGQRAHAVAVVAVQPSPGLMPSVPGIAALAGGAPAALVTDQGRGIATAVEKQHHLIARRQMLRHQLLQLGRESGLQPHVLDIQDHLTGGLGIAGAASESEVVILASASVVQCLQRRGGRAKQDGDTGTMGPHHRQIPRVVAKTVLLLEGAVMLLVDDDDAEVVKRGEHRGAGADQNGGATVATGEPGIEPFPVVHGGVHRHHRHVEATAEAVDGLRGEADLGHHHQRLLAHLEQGFEDAQVNLGFAGAGDAVQQEGTELVALAGNGRDGQRLLAVEAQPLPRFKTGSPVAIVARLQRTLLQQPLLLQRGEGCALDLLLLEGGGGLRPLAQQSKRLLLLGCPLEFVEIDGHTGVGGKPELQLAIGGRLPLAHQHRQGMGQHLPQRVLVVAGAPVHQRQNIGPQHGSRIQHALDRLELVARHLAVGRVIHHQPDEGLRAERDLDPTTGNR